MVTPVPKKASENFIRNTKYASMARRDVLEGLKKVDANGDKKVDKAESQSKEFLDVFVGPGGAKEQAEAVWDDLRKSPTPPGWPDSVDIYSCELGVIAEEASARADAAMAQREQILREIESLKMEAAEAYQFSAGMQELDSISKGDPTILHEAKQQHLAALRQFAESPIPPKIMGKYLEFLERHPDLKDPK